MSDLSTILDDAFRGQTLLYLVLSGQPKGRRRPNGKLTVRPVVLRGRRKYQFAERTNGKEVHKNLAPDEAAERIRQLFGPEYRDCHLFTTQADVSMRLKPDGTVTIKRGPPTKRPIPETHDRPKRRLIPENEPCPFLIEIGVMTRTGKVRAAKQDKFRQVNRFVELVDDVLGDWPPDRALNAVDFGSGKSYLTFALYHLIHEIHGRTVRLVGLERDPEVVHQCRQVAERLGCDGLEFHIGDIAEHEPEGPVDLAVSLHACDTATDDALAQAVRWKANVILAVPCCQHELFSKIHAERLMPLQQHGILKERFAALATDALRAQILELCGYKTQVVEFVETEHTAKNLLIRAVRRDRSSHEARAGELQEQFESYARFKAVLGLKRIHLEEALGEALPIRPGILETDKACHIPIHWHRD